jgi:hypothetical protein
MALGCAEMGKHVLALHEPRHHPIYVAVNSQDCTNIPTDSNFMAYSTFLRQHFKTKVCRARNKFDVLLKNSSGYLMSLGTMIVSYYSEICFNYRSRVHESTYTFAL